MSDREDLAAWIEELRARHAAGEFRGRSDWRILPYLTIGDVDRSIGAMLAEVDRFRTLLPENRGHFDGPRQLLVEKLLGLRCYLDGRRIGDAELERIRVRSGVGT